MPVLQTILAVSCWLVRTLLEFTRGQRASRKGSCLFPSCRGPMGDHGRISLQPGKGISYSTDVAVNGSTMTPAVCTNMGQTSHSTKITLWQLCKWRKSCSTLPDLPGLDKSKTTYTDRDAGLVFEYNIFNPVVSRQHKNYPLVWPLLLLPFSCGYRAPMQNFSSSSRHIWTLNSRKSGSHCRRETLWWEADYWTMINHQRLGSISRIGQMWQLW